MEVLQFVSQFGKALWDLKVMYDQHVHNGKDMKELLSFMQDYDAHIHVLQERFKEGGGNGLGVDVLELLEKDIAEATKELQRWSKDKSFFRVFNSKERMEKIAQMHTKVMTSVQKNMGIASLSMLIDVHATQATILESNGTLQAMQATIEATFLKSHEEMKSFIISSIGSMHGAVPAQVKEMVLEASTSSFADTKYRQDIVAAVEGHHEELFAQEATELYEDPITATLMIDPVVASDGNTYCRWTIIDNNLTKDPCNSKEDLTIVVDNLVIRRRLFERYPEKFEEFRQRRYKYRSHAVLLASEGFLSDAEVALQHVLQWDKNDKECGGLLNQVQASLKEAREQYILPILMPSNEVCCF